MTCSHDDGDRDYSRRDFAQTASLALGGSSLLGFQSPVAAVGGEEWSVDLAKPWVVSKKIDTVVRIKPQVVLQASYPGLGLELKLTK